MQNVKRIGFLGAGILILASACSSSKGNHVGSGGATTSAPGASSSSVPAPTGSTLKLVRIASPLLPGGNDGITAAVDAINAAGGVNGHPLQFVYCNDTNVAATATQCANKYAADPSVIAFVGNATNFGATVDPILAAAHIACIGCTVLTPADYTSPVIFPTSITGNFDVAGEAALLTDELHITNIGLAGCSGNPACSVVADNINTSVLGPRGLKLSAVAGVPLTGATDLSPEVATLSSTKGIAFALTESTSVTFIETAHQQGYTGALADGMSVFTASYIQHNIPSADSENLYLAGAYNISSPGYQRYLGDMAKYLPSGDQSDFSSQAWLGTQIFASVAKGISGDITRQAVLNGMNQLSSYDTQGMLPTVLNYTVPGSISGAPRLVPALTQMYAYKYNNGTLTAVGNGPFYPYK